MRILLVTRNLPPLVGGMERLNWHMIDQLSQSAEVAVVCSREAVATLPQQVKTCTAVSSKSLGRFLVEALISTIRLAQSFKPDIIIAGSGLMAPHVMIASKLCGAKSIGYLHGLDITANHFLYKAFWLPAIRRLDRVIANSTPTSNLLKNIGVSPLKTGIVYPGVTLPEPISKDEIAAFKSKYSILDNHILLSVGRLTERKGLKEFILNALPEIIKEKPNTKLLIAGGSANQSLMKNFITPDEILKTAKQLGIEKSIVFTGILSERELSLAYFASDIHIFPVKHIAHDPEGFGMVAIEAAAHGIPTIAFATGGIVDAVKDGASGFLVAHDDYNALAAKTVSVLNSSILLHDKIIEHAKKFEWTKFGANINNQLRWLID